MLIVATWRISLGGVVLLDWGDATQDEVSLDRSGPVEKVEPIGSEFAQFKPRKNVSHTLHFTRVKRLASDSAARDFLLDHAVALQFPEAVDCTIEKSNGGDSQVLQGAVLLDGSPNMRTSAEFFYASYRLSGGALVFVPNLMASIVDLVSYTPAAAGNDNIESVPDIVSVDIQVGAGIANFTRTISLLAGVNPGATRDVHIQIPASVFPTIEIHDLTAGGTLLHTETGVAGGVTDIAVRFKWDGTHWSKWGPANKTVT